MNSIYSKFLIVAFSLCFSSALLAHVQVDYPVGGESFTAGQQVNVKWHITIAHNTLNWDLFYSTDGGATWQPIELDLPAGQSEYAWTVPAGVTSEARVRVFQDNSATDYQDESQNFTVLGSTATSNPHSDDSDIKVYPNPASDILNIEFDEQESNPLQISFIDAFGNALWLNENTGKSIHIPLSQYASGVYFLMIKEADRALVRRVIVL